MRKQLLAKDLADLKERRPPVGKLLFKVRVQSILRTKKAQQVAGACAGNLRKVADEVVRLEGAATCM